MWVRTILAVDFETRFKQLFGMRQHVLNKKKKKRKEKKRNVRIKIKLHSHPPRNDLAAPSLSGRLKKRTK